MNVNLVKFKMREYIDVWVTSPNRGPPLPCKQALLTAPVLYVVRVRVRQILNLVALMACPL